MDYSTLVRPLVASLLFSLVGMFVFVGGFFLLARLLPFDVHKELEVDQNVAVGLVMASFILGLAFIIGMAIHG
jgi:putative membrane protein